MTKLWKLTVEQRAGCCCEYCRVPVTFSHDPFCMEHIIPLAKGGITALQNLAFACQGCNGHKSVHTHGKDPLTQLTASLFHPRQDVWEEHFEWQNNFQLVIGLTPTGRATVNRLQMNRPGLQKLRKVLVAAGEHPPL